MAGGKPFSSTPPPPRRPPPRRQSHPFPATGIPSISKEVFRLEPWSRFPVPEERTPRTGPRPAMATLPLAELSLSPVFPAEKEGATASVCIGWIAPPPSLRIMTFLGCRSQVRQGLPPFHSEFIPMRLRTQRAFRRRATILYRAPLWTGISHFSRHQLLFRGEDYPFFIPILLHPDFPRRTRPSKRIRARICGKRTFSSSPYR